MFRPRNLDAPRRRAVILMVVLVLLTLFAIVGLAFVLYANNEANSSRIWREAVSLQDNHIDIDPDLLGNYSIGQLVFDVEEPLSANNKGAFSAIRGHSLARDMYGWNSGWLTDQANNTPSIFAFNGVGRLHSTAGNPWGAQLDDHALLSYVPYPADNFTRDPERLGTRGLFAAIPPTEPYTGGWHSSYTYPDGNHAYLGAVDADGHVLARSFWRPYLLPNTTAGNPCLPLDPSSPSYWTWFTDKNPNAPTETVPMNPSAPTRSILRYYSLRPRNADMAAGFPPPGLGGDVQNLVGYSPSGVNDSVWVDLDYPVQTAADGTQFKPLFAFFIADLDGRINVNTAGNARNVTANPPTHVSNQGWGPWEVNPAWLSGGAPGEWPQMLVGSANQPNVKPRYGFDRQPSASGSVAPSGQTPRVYGQVDYDGSDDTGANKVGGNPTAKIVLPTDPAGFAGANFPTFPQGYNNGFQPERTNHGSVYDSQYPGGDDRRFTAHDHLLQMYNGGQGSTAAAGTDLGRLLPNTLGGARQAANGTFPNFRARNMLTTDSADRLVPALTPWVYDRTSTSPNAFGYGAAPLQPNVDLAPTGGAVNFPAVTVAQRNQALPGTPNPKSEFTIDWKAADAALGMVDLNRFLPPYPHMGQGTTQAGYNSTPLVGPYARFDPIGAANAAAITGQYRAAEAARQTLANDIYRRLLAVTSMPAPQTPATPTDKELAPRRYLAQLAVNIVDFIDEDEISTPFNFYTVAADGLSPTAPTTNPLPPGSNAPAVELQRFWVFGTELPKVVLNEVLAEYSTTLDATGKFKATNPTPVNVYAELYNTTPGAQQYGGQFPATVQQQDASPIPLTVAATGGAQTAYNPYQVVIADSSDPVNPGTVSPAGLLLMPAPNGHANVLGTVHHSRKQTTETGTTDFSNPAQVQTIDGKPTAASIAPQQFFLLSPTPPGGDANKSIAPPPAPGRVPTGTPMMVSANMTYNVNYSAPQQFHFGGQLVADGPNATTAGAGAKYNSITPITNARQQQITGITVALRRLANPHLPPNANPAAANYNPYVTVDVMTNVMPMDSNTKHTNKAFESSITKAQPYAANPATYMQQQPPQPAMGQPAVAAPYTIHSFGGVNVVNNATPATPYDWLVHLDRQLISPMELLNVSATHPHGLTYEFLPKVGWRYGHQADWYTESNRLYRAFAFLTTRSRAAGVSGLGGRQPGKVNINTVWNQEVLEALADPQAGNSFTQADVDKVFGLLVKSRSPGYTVGAGGNVTGKDRPFLGMGIGNMPNTDPVGGVYDDGSQKPNNTGIEDTLLRSNGAGGRLFDVTGQNINHPYRQTELMTKIFNNVTTRSNVFAVWVTVGFFRVSTDAAGTVQHVDGRPRGPVKLAEEIGYSTGTNVRHRIFAVVDRSKLGIGGPKRAAAGGARSVTTLGGAVAQNQLNQPHQVALAAVTGTAAPNNIPWTIGVGSVLDIDVGTPQEETVVVTAINGNRITATFTKTHAARATVQIPGNPGPQIQSNPNWALNSTEYSGVVLTYTVMQ